VVRSGEIKWPIPIESVNDFYNTHMNIPLTLFRDLQPKKKGSQRPAGQRKTLWTATIILAAAALEVGLEQIVSSAHGVRSPSVDPARVDRKRLVEDPLMTPSPVKIRNLLFAHFGIELDALPPQARFEVRFKAWAKGGAGQGTAQPGPRDWSELASHLDAVNHIRNGAAHADQKKLNRPPASAEGLLWVPLQNDGWSIQQPHGLNALRVVTAVFNTVAMALDQSLSLFGDQQILRNPDDVVTYEAP